MIATTINDFKKEKVIGKGSFGSVYLVRRIADNKIYALKTVILDKLSKKEQENSVNEVRILASINHPNVIGYKEAFWDDKTNSLNIVMEYADDGDLQSKILKMRSENGLFKESIIWEYSIQMIQGLKALHDKKIMHRDLKSANVFLFKENNKCKLGDMNVSKVIKEKVLLTQTGTPYYASPEVWRDEPYSYKSDLWSIGCVIYELCELYPPFKGKDLDELFEDVCRGQPKRINKLYSNELWNMIKMLLQVDVEKRVDCDMFLKSKLIKEKIIEMKNNPNIYNLNGINLGIYNDGFQQGLLNTIKFSNLNEIKYQLPKTKNYNCIQSNNDIKNKGIFYIKRTIIKKSSSLNKKTSRNKDNDKNELNGKEDNNTLIEKLKAIQAKKEKIKNRLIKQINSNNSRGKNINMNIDKYYTGKEKSKYKYKIKLNINKNISKREIKTEQNSEQKLYANKLIYNKSDIFDYNKYITNKIKRLNTDNNKISIFKCNPRLIHKIKTNNKIVMQKNNSKYKIKNIPIINCDNNILIEFLKKNYDNFTSTPPSKQLIQDKNNIPINCYNKLLKNNNYCIPISTSSPKINNNILVNNICQSFDDNSELLKLKKSIKHNNKKLNLNHGLKSIINIPTGKDKNKYKKEFKQRKISPNLIKRKNTYTNEYAQYTKGKSLIRIQSISGKRNKSLNNECKNLHKLHIQIKNNNIKNINSIKYNNYYRKYNSIKSLHKNNNTEILTKDTSFNSLNSKSKINNSSFEKIFIKKKLDNKNIIINNFNNYKKISSNIKIKKKKNNDSRTLSNQLNLHKNSLNKNIKYKKLNFNYHTNNNTHRKNNETEVNSLLNYLQKSLNNSDLTEDIFDRSTNKTTIKSNMPNVELNNFLKKNRSININNENESNNCKKIIINNINKLNSNISPKERSSQIYNNYYSFNNIEATNIPVKVINIYKK